MSLSLLIKINLCTHPNYIFPQTWLTSTGKVRSLVAVRMFGRRFMTANSPPALVNIQWQGVFPCGLFNRTNLSTLIYLVDQQKLLIY